MTSDIQERLRATKPHTNHGANSGLCHEAADTIDSLLKRIEVLEDDKEALHRMLDQRCEALSVAEDALREIVGFDGSSYGYGSKLKDIARAALSDGIVKG